MVKFSLIHSIGRRNSPNSRYVGKFLVQLLLIVISAACQKVDRVNHPRISLVNAPTDIVTLGAEFLAGEIKKNSGGILQPEVYHSGVLSGGKGITEIEMCQQGSIQIHITSTAYLSNLVPEMSVVSLPFMFRDLDQVIKLVKSQGPALQEINEKLQTKNLHVIAWWPRGFRQLTNSRRPVTSAKDMIGLKLRVMNNQLFVDNINAMGSLPVPMEWGEVYNGLQLHTIDGQENAEQVIYSSKLHEIQPYMTVWDYSTDLEVVLVNKDWWLQLPYQFKEDIRKSADASTIMQIDLLISDTDKLRTKIGESGVAIHYLSLESRQEFKELVKPVWARYEKIFGSEFMNLFISEVSAD